MSPRLRRLVLAALIIMVPLLVIPSVASAQAPPGDDQQAPTAATPGANLFHTNSPFLVSSDAVSGSSAMAARRRAKSEGFGIGVKIGPLFDSLSGGNVSYDSRTGIEGGIWFGGNRGGRVGVMGEILYAKKGASQSGVGADVYYLEIPILMRINIGSENKNGLSFYILAGEVNDIKLKSSLPNGVKDNFGAYNSGILVGVGVEVVRFLVEVRETFGLQNVFKVDTDSGTISAKSQSFAVLVGFRFN